MPSTPSKQYVAHVREKEDGTFEIHDLEDHLRAVAKGLKHLRSVLGVRSGAILQDCGMILGNTPMPFKVTFHIKVGLIPKLILKVVPDE